jgi:histidyl-tRNA synthetase
MLDASDRGLAEITELMRLAEEAGIGDRVELDATIARGLAYYTGTVFETFLADLPDIGSVMSGGRYDDLLRAFAGRDLPSVGVSLGISRLTAALEELGLAKARQTPARVLVAYFGPETSRETLDCASVLRRAGIPTVAYPGKAKLGKQYRYADRLGVSTVCLVGPDEAEAGKVRVKFLETGEQRDVPIGELADALRRE